MCYGFLQLYKQFLLGKVQLVPYTTLVPMLHVYNMYDTCLEYKK